jgi:DNA-binding winged helix-turn-helix (wHTH) protein
MLVFCRPVTKNQHQLWGCSGEGVSPFRFDTANQCLWRSHDTGEYERVLLAPKAFGVLRYLVEHPNRLVTHSELIEALWPDTFVQPAVLSSHIRDLRSALGDNPKNPRFIETLARRGYRFIAAGQRRSQDGRHPNQIDKRKPCGKRRCDRSTAGSPSRDAAAPAAASLCYWGAGHRQDRPGGRVPAQSGR